MGPPKNAADVIESGSSDWSPTTRNKMKQYWQVGAGIGRWVLVLAGGCWYWQVGAGIGRWVLVLAGGCWYWQIYAPSVESMMLSHDAPHLAVEEQEEIMNYVPSATYKGKKVLELGAGIGRYTTLLLENGVKEITAVDFMEVYVEENRKQNGHFSGANFLCADVTTLQFPQESFDMVFSNWLLMYLTDREVEGLLCRMLSWLTPEGHIFIRESCYHQSGQPLHLSESYYHQSGNVKRTENPSFYRTPLEYASKLGQCCTIEGETYHLIKAKSIQTYINLYRNPYQLCFLAQKTAVLPPTTGLCRKSIVTAAAASTEQELNTALLQESIHGKTWGCYGGGESALVLARSTATFEGKTVLDANCATGGLVMHFAQEGAARVVGLTSSPVCLHLSLLHLNSKGKEIIAKTSFELSSLLEWERRDKFDIVCANQMPLNKTNGTMVLAKLRTLLKESGQMLISIITSSIKNSDLLSEEELRTLAASAGFQNIETSINADFLPSIIKELAASKETLPSSDMPDVQREDYVNKLQDQVEKVSKGLHQLTVLSAAL
ncbi:S-adenosyl-L-methionine-dependent methyltransferase [Trinorchestia longiramus]|nr:S-adenosyl-L-methionine-dependent methyltransferase [Trinorchestia longiramus]